MADRKEHSKTASVHPPTPSASGRPDDTTSPSGSDAPDTGGGGEIATPDRLGPCRILRTLGSGAAGTVFLGELIEPRDYASLGTPLAVKVLHPGLIADSVASARFLREAELGRTLRHPAVVSTFEAGESRASGVIYRWLILEYVEGQTLRELMASLGRIPESLLRTIAVQAAAGLETIHAAGAVHRDLKPRNILITAYYQVKLSDLGVALLEDEAARLTRTGHFVGTLLYCAPEQICGERVTPESDLYSLGVMLYEGATGSNPFEAATAQAVMRRHLEHVPPRAGTLNPQITPLLEELIACLIDKQPARRLRSAAALKAVLEVGETSPWWREREREIARRESHGARRRNWVARPTAYVGHATELAQLNEFYREAVGGHGRLVMIEGEAGIGKTRLVDELVRGIEARGERFHVLYGTYPRGGAEGPGALVQAVVQHFGEGGIEEGIQRYLARAPRLVTGFTALLLGAPPRPGTEALNAGGLIAALCYLARALAAEAPLVWVIEDLHNASADSRARLPALAWALADQPVLLIGTALPGLPVEDLAALSRLEITRRMPLSRLTRGDVEQLLHEAFHSTALASRLAERINAKAGGNPLFVLETIRDLKERKLVEPLADGSFTPTQTLADIEIPSTVRDLLLARVSGIGLQERQMLEVGAVQGVAFDPDLVSRVLGRNRLEVLQRLSEIERRHAVVRSDGTGFVFDSPQLRDVVYKGLPPLLRREYHALLAEVFAERGGLGGRAPADVPGEAAVFLTEHFLHGGEGERAVGLLLRALEHLALRQQNEAIADKADLALGQPGVLTGGMRADVRLAQAEALRLLSRRAEELRAVEDAILSAPDEARAARARRALGRLLLSFSDFTGSREALAEAVRRAHAAGDRMTEARALTGLGDVFLNLGELASAREHHEKSLALCAEIGDRAGEARATIGLGAVLGELCEFEAALAACRRAEALFRDLGQPQNEVKASLTGGVIQLRLGHIREATERFERTLNRSRELGDRVREAMALAWLGGALHHQGDLGGARQHLERAIEMFREMVDRLGEVGCLAALGRIALDEGKPAEAEEQLTFCSNVCRALGIRPLLVRALTGLGDVHRARGDGKAALDAYAHAVDAARSVSSAAAAPAVLAYGRSLLEAGGERLEEARALLLEADALAASAPAEVAPLAAAYLALAGLRDPAAVTVPDEAPAAVQAEAWLAIHRARGSTERDALERARARLGQVSAHLDPAALSAFWRLNPTARGVREEESRIPER